MSAALYEFGIKSPSEVQSTNPEFYKLISISYLACFDPNDVKSNKQRSEAVRHFCIPVRSDDSLYSYEETTTIFAHDSLKPSEVQCLLAKKRIVHTPNHS
jgi:hypothetical protein